jgi:hypothetical protein
VANGKAKLASRVVGAIVLLLAIAVPLRHSARSGLIAGVIIGLGAAVFLMLRERYSWQRWRPWALSLAIGYAAWLYYLVWADWTLDFTAPIEIAGVVALFAVGAGCLTVRLGGRALAARDADRRPLVSRYELGYLFGLAVVLMLYATVAVVAASLVNPLIRPTAAVLASSRGLCGVFVAENADHVYIGEPIQDPHDLDRGVHEQGQLLELPRNAVTQLAIGSSQPLPSAATRSPEMLTELLHSTTSPPGDHCSWKATGVN